MNDYNNYLSILPERKGYSYLDTLPEVRNRFRLPLMGSEKVIFTAKNVDFTTETGRGLGVNSKLTLTNRRLVVDNGVGVWTVEIPDGVKGCRKNNEGAYSVALDLYDKIVCGDDEHPIVMTGFVFMFSKEDEARFMEIMINFF